MTTVLITGATGFIARHLAVTLQAADVRVLGVSHSSVVAPPAYARVARTGLGDSLLPLLAEERIDAIVHTALATGTDEYRLNVEGTARWLDEGRAAGVPLQILLSTLSADADALSLYGRAKWAQEQRFQAANEVVFRLGVVVGNGGMFVRIRQSATRLPITPLLNGGSQQLYVAGVDAICAVLRDTILAGGAGLRGRAWNLVQPEPVTLRTLIQAIQRDQNQPTRLLSVPVTPVLWAVRLLEGVPMLRLPISSANVRGLVQQGQRHVMSDWARFGYPTQSLEALLRQVPGGATSK